MIHHPPPPLTHTEAVMTAEVGVSGVAWDNASNRWRVRSCKRRPRHEWRCIGQIDLHNEDGTWTPYTLYLRVHGDFEADLTRLTHGASTTTPTIPVWRET